MYIIYIKGGDDIMEWKSFIIGMFAKPLAGVLTNKAVDEVWDKSKETIKKSKEPALPFVGIIKGVNKKY